MKSVLCVAALATSSAAMAGTSIVQNVNFDEPLSPASFQLLFNQFNDNNGLRTLKQVTLSIDATISADATAENDSALAAPLFQLQYNGSMIFDLLTLSGADLANGSSGASLAPSDGINGSGPDYNDFGTVTLGLSDSDSTTMNLAGFIGGGQLFGNVNALGGFSFSGTTDASLGFDNFRIFGTATLTYAYNEIPAPGAAALFGLGGLAAARRRR